MASEEKKAETFSDISEERQWGWGEELEVLWDLIEDKGLGDEAVRYARRQADREIAEETGEKARVALQKLVDMVYGARNLRSPGDDHDTRLAIESVLVDTGIEPTK